MSTKCFPTRETPVTALAVLVGHVAGGRVCRGQMAVELRDASKCNRAGTAAEMAGSFGARLMHRSYMAEQRRRVSEGRFAHLAHKWALLLVHGEYVHAQMALTVEARGALHALEWPCCTTPFAPPPRPGTPRGAARRAGHVRDTGARSGCLGANC